LFFEHLSNEGRSVVKRIGRKQLLFFVWIAGVSYLLPLFGNATEDESPFAVAALSAAAPSEHLLGWIDSRKAQSLNGSWKILVDPMQVGTPGSLFGGWATTRVPENDYQLLEYSYPSAADIRVPGDFNTQVDELLFYRDMVWYQRFFDVEIVPDKRYHLWFGATNFEATVFLNGSAIVQQKGGYVPFSVDVTEHVKADQNDLVISVNNRLNAETIPTGRTDWWPYGGLTRDVLLIETSEAYITNAQLAQAETAGRINGHVSTFGMPEGTPVTIEIPGAAAKHIATVDGDSMVHFSFDAEINPWSPEAPVLYDVHVSAGEDLISDRIGFRTIETQGKSILLNGQPIRLKGISTHEEPIGRDGVAYSYQDMMTLFTEAKALGANFIRAAHYPYSRHAARVADELGLLLWEEIPIYWNIAFENPDTLGIARDQLSRLIQRDWNRASVIVWSVANETVYSKPRMLFLERLITDARELDGTRLISAALLGDTRRELQFVTAHLAAYGLTSDVPSAREKKVFEKVLESVGEQAPVVGSGFDLVITDPLGELVDLVSYNEYFGWYYSRFIADQTGVSERTIRKLMLAFIPEIRISSAFDKPIVISEFGAGAKAGNRGAGVWTEDYQANVYRAQVKMIANSEAIQGITPWILKDFRAMLRSLGGVQDYRNRKGLIDENGRRKKAFYVLRDFYEGPWSGVAPN
jgi:beta-glucuronidase